jgi:hypothetical protein
MKEYILKKRLATEKWFDENCDALKAVHKTVYSFLIWDFYLGQKHNCGRFFIHELRSDGVQSIPTVFVGYKKATALLLRGLIENCLRYIYYHDHPVEFSWLESGHYLQIKELIEYCKKHPTYSLNEKSKKVLDELWSVYVDISRYVHAQAVKHMELTKAMEEIRFDPAFFNWYVRKIKTIGSLINLVLGMFNENELKSFDHDFKRLIIRLINKGYRHLVWESS